MPKLSFVLPTHNRIAWMPRCLETLQDQTEKDIEIIVINDNSNDGTKEFLDAWAVKDPRVVVVHNEQNLGAGKSRNIGFGLAKSEIVGICDDDDEYPEDHAETVLRWFQENPNSELVNFPYMRIGYFAEHLEPFWGSKFDAEAFKKDGSVNYFCNPSVAVKKEAALNVGGYGSETLGMTDDIQFVKRWIEAGKVIDFDNRAIGVLHRVMPDSMMAKQRGFQPEWAGAK
jgi:glycosyltransferase involved in cell wall biosynthesis